jgi:hypothetical protein
MFNPPALPFRSELKCLQLYTILYSIKEKGQIQARHSNTGKPNNGPRQPVITEKLNNNLP